MPKNFRAVLCQNDLRPAYYDDFHCLMAGCRLNCCTGGWHITFGKKDYLTIKKQRGSAELNAGLDHCLRRIRENVDEQYRYGEFVLQDGCCPLLREGKCGLQMEKGAKVLPFVCRTFPRTETPMPSGYLERTLTPACEGVLALLWELPEGVDFRSDPLQPEEQRVFTFEEDGSTLLPHFQEIRELCVDILQDRCRSLPERMLLLGMALRPLSEGEDVTAWLPWARSLPGQVEPGTLLGGAPDEKTLKMFLLDMRKIFGPGRRIGTVSVTVRRAGSDQTERMEAHPRENLTPLQQTALTLLGSGDTVSCRPYLKARARYEERFKGREYFMENLMVNILFHLRFPGVTSPESVWKGYVNLCNLYACHRFAAVLSCREGVEDNKAELFRLLVLTSRALLHNVQRQSALSDDLFDHDSATLSHMAILLCG